MNRGYSRNHSQLDFWIGFVCSHISAVVIILYPIVIPLCTLNTISNATHNCCWAVSFMSQVVSLSVCAYALPATWHTNVHVELLTTDPVNGFWEQDEEGKLRKKQQHDCMQVSCLYHFLCPCGRLYNNMNLNGYKWRVLFHHARVSTCLLHQSTPSYYRGYHHTHYRSWEPVIYICDMFGLLLIATTVHVLLPLMCQSSPVYVLDEPAEWTDQQLQDQLEQEQYACLLRNNTSLVNDFQQSVRERHGINDPSYGMCMHKLYNDCM